MQLCALKKTRVKGKEIGSVFWIDEIWAMILVFVMFWTRPKNVDITLVNPI
jgi:hypothetical protein